MVLLLACPRLAALMPIAPQMMAGMPVNHEQHTEAIPSPRAQPPRAFFSVPAP